MSDLLIDRVQQNLRRLRFVRAPEDLSEILAQAERESLSPLSVLDMVLDLEVASKEDRRIATSLKLASLPFVKTIKEDESSGRNIKARSHSKAALVVVDEVGYTPIDRRECYLFFRFVSRRYEKASLVITSNKGFAEWTELFEDPIIVAALLDRLLQHSVIVNIKGQSYRLRGKGSSVRKAAAEAGGSVAD